MSVILKESYSLKGKDLLPLITRVKELRSGNELARLSPTRPIQDMTFDDLREEFHNLTDESMNEILVRAGLPVDINNGRLLLHHTIVLANEVGEPSIQDEDQTLLKSAAVNRPTKRHSDQANGTSSKFPKCDEGDSQISGYQWFKSNRQKSKWLINQNRCVLVKNGCFSGIRDHLLQAEILTDYEVQEIEKDEVEYQQMRRFVDKLCQKPNKVIEKCCEEIRLADRNLYDQLQWPCPPSPDQVHQGEVDVQMSDDLGKIQQELKSWYTDQLSHFHPIPWCDWVEMDFDHVYTNLKLVKGFKQKLNNRDGAKQPNDIDDTEGLLGQMFKENGRGVTFIQGPAGIGKSMLCRRLAFLWATDNSCIHGRTFDVVLLVEARSIVGDNLKQSIVKQLFPEDYDMTEEAISQCIKRCGKNGLLIIDGVDELTEEGKTEVKKLLEGRFFRHTNIILTGRTESVKDFVKHVGVHLEVSGFTRGNAKSYIRKYFQDQNKELPGILLNLLYFWDANAKESDDNDFDERYLALRELCNNPFMTCLLCQLAEEKGDDISYDENAILEEVITLTLERYVGRINIEGVTTEKLLSKASEVAWKGFSEKKQDFSEEFIQEFCTDGLGEHLLKSGLLNRDFTMCRFQTSGYCWFPHRSIQDYHCAKYLATIPQTSLDEFLLSLPLEDNGWWLGMVMKLLYQLEDQGERLRRCLLCILECPVSRKLKPGFQKYVGRLTNEKRMELNKTLDYIEMLDKLKLYYEDIVLSVLAANDDMLRIYVPFQMSGFKNPLALPVLYYATVTPWHLDDSLPWGYEFCSFREDSYLDYDSYVSHGFFESCGAFDYNLLLYVRTNCCVEHKISHVYISRAPFQWAHLDNLTHVDITPFSRKDTKLPSVLSVLVLPGFMDIEFVQGFIDRLNSANTKLTLFLIIPQLECEDLFRNKLLSLIRSGISPYIQVCCVYPNGPVYCEYTTDNSIEEEFRFVKVDIKYRIPEAIHHMYYNKYCPF